MNHLQVDLGKIMQSNSPQKEIEMMLERLARKYQCDRVYLFEKNAEGNYDCSDEWVCDGTRSKKHLLQNLSEKAVEPYYGYFHREGMLVIRDMDEFKKEDDFLGKMLKEQDLRSVLVGQLLYNNMDIGFIGIDNPNIESFDELVELFKIVVYHLAILKYRIMVKKQIDIQKETVSIGAKKKLSMYTRAAEFEAGKPLSVIYCSVIAPGGEKKTEAGQDRVGNCAMHVFGSVFGRENVYNLGNYEFLIICEEFADQKLYEMDYYMKLAEKTLYGMNIHLSKGIAVTDCYDNDFFDLVNLSNARMQKELRKYRELYIGKYHLPVSSDMFGDLLEIRPQRDTYQIIYSEHIDNPRSLHGSWKQVLKWLTEYVRQDERESFIKFWHHIVEEYMHVKEFQKPISKRFHFLMEKRFVENLEVTVFHYTDVHGEEILMCYTR